MGEMAKLAEQAPMADTTAELAVREKVVVITGAARGIGQEFARSLAAAGAYVVAADMNDCSATIESITAGNGKAIGIALDVRSARSASDMISAATGAFGHVDALINNAALYGALRGGRFDAIAEADWDAAMAVNVKGIGRDSIRVNALAPSAVLTDGTREFFGDKAGRALEVIKAGQSIQRNLTPPDLVGAVVWLVSDASRFVTGQTIAIDGGTVML